MGLLHVACTQQYGMRPTIMTPARFCSQNFSLGATNRGLQSANNQIQLTVSRMGALGKGMGARAAPGLTCREVSAATRSGRVTTHSLNATARTEHIQRC